MIDQVGAESLVEVKDLIVANVSTRAVASSTLAAHRYDTFWHTGEERYAKAALSPDFPALLRMENSRQQPWPMQEATPVSRAGAPDPS
jgi:hypothetical protein